VQFQIVLEVSTASFIPARINMNSLRGPWSIAVPIGQEPAHMPHCMHNDMRSPPSTFL
jgi:hypothetical protein